MDDDMYLTGVSWAVGYFVLTLLWWFGGGGIEREYLPPIECIYSLHFTSLSEKKQIPAIGANLVVIIIIIIIIIITIIIITIIIIIITFYPFPPYHDVGKVR